MGKTIQTDKNKKIRIIIFILFLFFPFIVLQMTGFPSIVNGANNKNLSVAIDIHSLEEANYSQDLNPVKIPGVHLDIIRGILVDRGLSLFDIDVRLATLMAILSSPIPFATPNPLETAFPMTRSVTNSELPLSSLTITMEILSAQITKLPSLTTTSTVIHSTNTPINQPTNTSTSQPTNTQIAAATNTITFPTIIPTSLPTRTATAQPIISPTSPPNNTPTSAATVTPTFQPTSSSTRQFTNTPTPRFTNTPRNQRSNTPTNQATSTLTPIPTSSPTRQSTITQTPHFTNTPRNHRSNTPTNQATSTLTLTQTFTPSPSPFMTPTEEDDDDSISFPFSGNNSPPLNGFINAISPSHNDINVSMDLAYISVFYNQPMEIGTLGHGVQRVSNYQLINTTDPLNPILMTIILVNYDPDTYIANIFFEATPDLGWGPQATFEFISNSTIRNVSGADQGVDVKIIFSTSTFGMISLKNSPY